MEGGEWKRTTGMQIVEVIKGRSRVKVQIVSGKVRVFVSLTRKVGR